jgi:hypothetical protein
MNPTVLLVVHPDVEKYDILKSAVKMDVRVIRTRRIDALPVNAYTKNIAFVYHKSDRFPFFADNKPTDYSSDAYMTDAVKDILQKYFQYSSTKRYIDLLSCDFPEYAEPQLREFVTNAFRNTENEQLIVRYSVDNTGNYPGNWIMEKTTEILSGETSVSFTEDVRPTYFNASISNWNVLLSSSVMFHNDQNKTFSQHFTVHKPTKIVTLDKDLTKDDIPVEQDSATSSHEHAYISLPTGYIFNGNGHTIDLSGMDINIKWKGLIECNTENYKVNQKNIIKSVGIISSDLNTSTRLAQGAGYIVREGQSWFDVYDSFAKGNVSLKGGGICGRRTGSNISKRVQNPSTIPGDKNNKNYPDVKIYSCFVQCDVIGTNAGGIVGHNSGKYSDIRIHSCFVEKMSTPDAITSSHKIETRGGGIFGSIKEVNVDMSYNTNVQIYSCYTNNQAIEAYAGGIVGEIDISNSVRGVDTSNIKFEVRDCYVLTSSSEIDASSGSIFGTIHYYNEISNNFTNTNNFSTDFSTNDVKIIHSSDNVYIGVGTKNILDLSGITDVSLSILGLQSMFNSPLDTSKNYPLLSSFCDMYSVDGNSVSSYDDRIVRQNYVYTNNYGLKRGFSPWDMSDISYGYKNSEYGTPFFSQHKKPETDKNAYVMKPILLLDMLHQYYPDVSSGLNKSFDQSSNKIKVSENTPQYYYPDFALIQDISAFNDFSDNILNENAGTIDSQNIQKRVYIDQVLNKYIERRFMMIRARNFLESVNDTSTHTNFDKSTEIDRLMQTRKNKDLMMNGENDYTLIESVIGDYTRLNKSKLINREDIYDDTDYQNQFEPKYVSTHDDQKQTRNNLLIAPHMDADNYTHKDVYFLNEFKEQYDPFARQNLYDSSILGNEKDVIKNFDISNSNDHYSKKMIDEMNLLASKIGEFNAYRDAYNYPYTVSDETQAYNFNKMEAVYGISGGDFGSDTNALNKTEILWVIYELLKSNKFNQLVRTNLTSIIEPVVGDAPYPFTSLDESKQNNIVLNIYNQYQKMYVNPIFYKTTTTTTRKKELTLNDFNEAHTRITGEYDKTGIDTNLIQSIVDANHTSLSENFHYNFNTDDINKVIKTSAINISLKQFQTVGKNIGMSTEYNEISYMRDQSVPENAYFKSVGPNFQFNGTNSTFLYDISYDDTVADFSLNFKFINNENDNSYNYIVSSTDTSFNFDKDGSFNEMLFSFDVSNTFINIGNFRIEMDNTTEDIDSFMSDTSGMIMQKIADTLAEYYVDNSNNDSYFTLTYQNDSLESDNRSLYNYEYNIILFAGVPESDSSIIQVEFFDTDISYSIDVSGSTLKYYSIDVSNLNVLNMRLVDENSDTVRLQMTFSIQKKPRLERILVLSDVDRALNLFNNNRINFTSHLYDNVEQYKDWFTSQFDFVIAYIVTYIYITTVISYYLTGDLFSRSFDIMQKFFDISFTESDFNKLAQSYELPSPLQFQTVGKNIGIENFSRNTISYMREKSVPENAYFTNTIPDVSFSENHAFLYDISYDDTVADFSMNFKFINNDNDNSYNYIVPSTDTSFNFDKDGSFNEIQFSFDVSDTFINIGNFATLFHKPTIDVSLNNTTQLLTDKNINFISTNSQPNNKLTFDAGYRDTVYMTLNELSFNLVNNTLVVQGSSDGSSFVDVSLAGFDISSTIQSSSGTTFGYILPESLTKYYSRTQIYDEINTGYRYIQFTFNSEGEGLTSDEGWNITLTNSGATNTITPITENVTKNVIWSDTSGMIIQLEADRPTTYVVDNSNNNDSYFTLTYQNDSSESDNISLNNYEYSIDFKAALENASDENIQVKFFDTDTSYSIDVSGTTPKHYSIDVSNLDVLNMSLDHTTLDKVSLNIESFKIYRSITE